MPQRHPDILEKPGPLQGLPPGATPDERESLLRDHWKALGKLQRHWNDLTLNGEYGWDRFLYWHSFYHFFRDVWYIRHKRHELNPRLHWDMARFWEPTLLLLYKNQSGAEWTDADEAERIKCMFCPRGTRKSSELLSFSPFVHLHLPTTRHLWMRSTIKNAYDDIRRLGKFWMQHPLFRTVFPEFEITQQIIKRNQLMWGKDGLELPVEQTVELSLGMKEPSFSVAGIDTVQTGYHFDLFLPDDVVDERNYFSEVGRRRVKNKFIEMMNVMDPRAPWCLDGTPWHIDDAYQWLRATPDEEDTDVIKPLVFHRKAIEDRYGYNSEPVYPEKLNRRYLAMLRKKIGEHVYNCQYNCEPINPEKAIFNMACTRYYRIDQIPGALNIYVLFDDAAKTTIGSSEKAMVVVGIDGTGNLYILNVLCGHFARSVIIQTLKQLYEYYHSPKFPWTHRMWFYGESVGGYDALRREINEKLRGVCPQLQLLEFPINTRGGNKINRIADLEPKHSDGRIFFRVKDKTPMELVDAGSPEVCEQHLYEGKFAGLNEGFKRLWTRMRDVTLDDDPKNTPLDDLDALGMIVPVFNPPKDARTSQTLDERPGMLNIEIALRQERMQRMEDFNRIMTFREAHADLPMEQVMQMDYMRRRRTYDEIAAESEWV